MNKEQLVKTREELTAEGHLRDSGKRRFNPETGEWEVVWQITKSGLAEMKKIQDRIDQAIVATDPGPLPENIEDVPAYTRNWVQLIKQHDSALCDLADDELEGAIRSFGNSDTD